MPSVFQLWGLQKTQALSTPIPQLGISNRVNSLQLKSTKYFTVPENAIAADADKLAVSIQHGQNFSLKNEEHLTHLRACTKLFNEKAEALRAIDRNIAISAVVGLIATSLSFIPFVGYFSLLGWGSALYFITQRTRAYDEYKESLNLLAATCNWSLGEGDEERQSPKEELTRNADIRDMMTSLYPVVTEKQARHLIADDIEKMFVAELNDYESKYTGTTSTFFAGGDDSIARSKRGAESYRCVYGLNKGNPTDFIDAFISIFPDIYNAIHHGFKKLQHWWTAKSGNDKGGASETAANAQPSA